jgi:cyclopropane-fatty-acyl-phospholipid synthase
MSHESIEHGRGVVYTLPGRFSDTLRTREFSQFFAEYEGACFSVRTLDGWSWSSSLLRAPQFTATFSTRDALDAVAGDATEATLGRLFLEGSVELEGNILVLLGVARYTLRHSDGLSHSLIQTLARLSHHFSRKLIPIHRISRKHNYHFAPCPLDLPCSFFEPWLGPFLSHSSYCPGESDEDLEPAQRRALERACAWLDLGRGDRMLDIGCGWGSLLVHAAQWHGACAQGIAATEMQCLTAAERIHRAALNRYCSVEMRDLRMTPFRSREFDKVSHLGIFEQVAYADLLEYLRSLRAVLVPGGLILLHRLTSSAETEACITLLPSGFLADGISRELQVAERAGFDVVRVESLQSEYQDTLRVWIERLLNAPLGAATRLFSSGYRAWMLYLIEVATCLNTEEAQVHSLLLRRRS